MKEEKVCICRMKGAKDLLICPIHDQKEQTPTLSEAERICKHNPILSKMSYGLAAEEGERRTDAGEVQKKCPVCNKYYFKDEFGEYWPTDPVIINVPEIIFISPNPDYMEDETGEVDYSHIDHEFTYFGETRSTPLDIEYVLASSLSNKEAQQSDAGWISVEDRLPEVGQVVDIWEMPAPQYLQRALSLRGTEFAKKYYNEADFVGWRSCNYKFSIESDAEGTLNCFTSLNEKVLTTKESYDYKKICVEEGKLTHWMPLPAPPKQ